ncbi:hypothetical protein GY45DRAFT_1434458 [Cubamyces sp. BRFM 1775]|nr:hypothetical protein GY45DRAFT_1434458 [Cubamyces sp. BRFM 1775]
MRLGSTCHRVGFAYAPRVPTYIVSNGVLKPIPLTKYPLIHHMQHDSTSGLLSPGMLSPAESTPRDVNTPKPPAIATRFKRPNSRNAAQIGPITTCAANVRTLKISSRQLFRALRDTRTAVSRLDVAGRDSFGADWVAIVDQYKNLLDDTDLAASQLMAIIKVYLILQSSKSEAQEADMITELGNLRQSLSERTYDLSSRCKTIRAEIQVSYDRLSNAVHTDVITGAGPQASKKGVSSSDTSGGTQPQYEMLWSISIVGDTDVFPCVRQSDGASSPPARKPSILGRLMSALLDRLLRRPRKSDRQTSKSSRRAVHPDRISESKEASQSDGERHIASGIADGRRPPARQDSQTDAIPTTLHAIQEIISGLETQAPLFEVFPELAQHLRNELDAYLHAFEAARAYPANRKKALDEAQARVVVSSKHWKECLAALNGDGSTAE